MNLPSKPLQLAVTIDSMSSYLKYVNTLPILSEEEERSLLNSFFNENDIESGKKIVLHHLRLVVKIALDCVKTNQKQLKDAISEGNIGLMEALTKFDPESTVRFSTYAMHWIRHRIQTFLIDSWSLVTSNKSKIKEYLFRKGDLKDAGEIMTEVSLDAPMKDDCNSRLLDTFSSTNQQNALTNIIQEENEISCRKDLKSAIKDLNEREKYIIQARYFKEEGSTLQDVSEILGISKERVRQIEVAALSKLRKRISKMPV